MPNGAKRKKPASRSSRLPKTLGESKRGMQSQSIAPSGRHERARVAVGQERVLRDRRERRGGSRALRHSLFRRGLAHDAIHGSCQRPWPATRASASAGPQEPGAYEWTGGGFVEQRVHDPPLFFDAVLPGEPRAVADQRRMEQHFVRSGALAALFGELHVELDGSGSGAIRPVSVEDEPDPGSTGRA